MYDEDDGDYEYLDPYELLDEEDELDESTHKHQCHNCGFIWEHSDSMSGNTIAHTCVCGKIVYARYLGDCIAQYIGNCRPVSVVVEVVKKIRNKVSCGPAASDKVSRGDTKTRSRSGSSKFRRQSGKTKSLS